MGSGSLPPQGKRRKHTKIEIRISHTERSFHVEQSQEGKREMQTGCRPVKHGRGLRHPERLLSFGDIPDEESASTDCSGDGSSCTSSEATPLDTAFSHALGSWQADTLSQ